MSIRNVLKLVIATSLLGLAAFCPMASGQQPAKKSATAPPTLDELNATYVRQLRDVDRRRVADLSALAARTNGPQADAAYATLFQLAVGRSLCPEADPAAERCLAAGNTGGEVRSLATLVRILAKADKGDHAQALDTVKALFKVPAGGGTALAVGEAYLQRLIRETRYDDALELCECACDVKNAPATLKEHFENRIDRLALLGDSAPAIAGKDVDGKAVSLAALKGKVVLVDFWATWCPPCITAIPRLIAAEETYRARGFEILGVNLDAMHENVKDAKDAVPAVRRFLVSHNVPWTNLLNGAGADDFAKAYGVSEIPANFLVGRDGKVIALELTDEVLDQAITRALANEPIGRGR